MDIDLLVKILNEGKLAIIPTDTTYGLIADATNEEAINKVFEAKKREKNKPLLILVANLSMLKKYIKELKPLEEEIIKEFWPGPLTIIFEKNEQLSNTLTAGQKGIAIRLPDNPKLIELITKLDKPIIATSANIAGEKTITSIDMLEEDILNKISYIYDNGKMNDIASTLIKVEKNQILFLRDGLLSPKIKDKLKQKKDFQD